jgi:hypothetical protein
MNAVVPCSANDDTPGQFSPRPEAQQACLPQSPLLLALAALELLAQLGEAFCQQRSALRAWRMALGQALTLGGRTISRIIASLNRDQRDWSADYRLFSRSPWKVRELFARVLREALPMAFPPQAGPQAPLWAAGDHTHVCKTGRHVAGVHTIRDPMSPAYHVNLIKGVRFFNLAVVVAPWRVDGTAGGQDVPARAIPVRFEPSPTVKKPGKKATELTHLALA